MIPIVAVIALALGACNNERLSSLQGYAEGEYVRVAAPYAGRLEALAVQRGQQVQAGAPLFTLERENEAAALREAQQRLNRAQAQLENLKKGKRPPELEAIAAQQRQAAAALSLSERQFKRQQELIARGLTAREQLDQARTALERDRARVAELAAQAETARLPARADEIDAAGAEVEAARAALAQAEWRLAQKTVQAPASGVVDDTFYTVGEWVPAGNPVVSILPPQNIKIRFFVPETQLGALRLGQRAQVRCDGCAAPIPVTLSYIAPQPEYTPPVIYSKESHNKLVFLVEAKPAPQEALRLHPGQPVDVYLQ